MINSRQNENFHPSLEGLRGLAILAVVFYHNFPFTNVFFGWLGVDLFFVLSGFLITTILLRSIGTEMKKGFLGHFYIRRALRIFPLYYLIILTFLFLLPALNLASQESSDYVNNRWWYFFYLQNWLYISHFPENSHFLDHFWSLSVEEQYYLVWPMILLMIRRPRQLAIFLTGALASLFVIRCLVWNAHIPGFNYTNFFNFTRFDGIIIGSLVAVVCRIKKDLINNHTATIFFALAFLNLLFYYLNSSGGLPYYAFIGFTTFAAMFGLLVYELIYRPSSVLAFLFSAKWLRFFGRISYGLYIFHWPIHYFLRRPVNRSYLTLFPNEPTLTAFLTSLTTTLIAIVISLASFYTLERVFLKMKRNFP